MAKNIIVSNRLPVQITKLENSYVFNTTSGGLATGMDSIHQGKNSLWIGWPGIASDSIDDDSYVPLINSLKNDVSGLDIVAFTNGPRKYALRLLKALGLDEFFPPDMVFARFRRRLLLFATDLDGDVTSPSLALPELS